MKIVINNVAFDYNIGCKLLKSKYKDVPFGNLGDIWEDIVPITFKEIATEINNLELYCILCGSRKFFHPPSNSQEGQWLLKKEQLRAKNTMSRL